MRQIQMEIQIRIQTQMKIQNTNSNEKIIIMHRTLGLLVRRLGCTLVGGTLSGRRIKRQIKPPNVAETEM